MEFSQNVWGNFISIMISFIIIGRNEGWKLTKCFESVFQTIEDNSVKSYEVIYVDSKSTDDSIKRARKYSKIKIIVLEGDINAAIARNVGAKESNGDVLFFLDGDMVVEASVFPLFYSNEKGLEYPFMSGNFDNYFYNQEWRFLKKDSGMKMKDDVKRYTVGGLFLIERELWNKLGGMRNEFERSQDIDLALRAAKNGILVLRKKEILVHHHMISYMNRDRKWKLLFSGADLYARSLLYRKNLFNRYTYHRFLFSEYSLIILIVSIFLLIMLGCFCYLMLYLGVLLYKSIKANHDWSSKLINIFYYFIRDLITLAGFFIFFPKGSHSVSYSIIEN